MAISSSTPLRPGLAKSDAIFLSEAKGVGLPVVYLGAKTGRDGVGGATMASAEFDETIEEKRPTVQVATLHGEVPAGGLPGTDEDRRRHRHPGHGCGRPHLLGGRNGRQGDLGIELQLDQVRVREERMTAYEMMLSESQERMLMVLEPAKEEVAKAIFVKWGLDFAIVGKTTDDLRFRVIHQGEEVANLPIKELGDQAPEYDRPWTPLSAPAPLASDDVPEADLAEALVTLVGSANESSRRWVYEQYDTLIQGNSLQLPGGDAASSGSKGMPPRRWPSPPMSRRAMSKPIF